MEKRLVIQKAKVLFCLPQAGLFDSAVMSLCEFSKELRLIEHVLKCFHTFFCLAPIQVLNGRNHGFNQQHCCGR